MENRLIKTYGLCEFQGRYLIENKQTIRDGSNQGKYSVGHGEDSGKLFCGKKGPVRNFGKKKTGGNFEGDFLAGGSRSSQATPGLPQASTAAWPR